MSFQKFSFLTILFLFLIWGVTEAAPVAENNNELQQGEAGLENISLNQETYSATSMAYNYGLIYLHFREMDALNQRTPPEFPDLNSGMLLRKSHYILGAPGGLKMGWVSFQGSQTREVGGGEDFRQISYELDMKGLLVEQTLFLRPRLDLAAGAVLGWGKHSVNLLFYDLEEGEKSPWQEAFSSKMEQNYLFIQPQLSVRIRILGNFTINLEGGYTLSAGRDKWSIGEQDLEEGRHRTDGFHISLALGTRF